MSRTVIARGTWPGRVTLRAGWSQATARPMNDDVTDATLRLDRGSADFLRRATDWLLDAGARSVVSIPLHPGTRAVWDEAGFGPFRQLLLMERDLSFEIPTPGHPTSAGGDDDWNEALEVDGRAFASEWRVGRLGLHEAHDVTSEAGFLIVRDDTGMLGFSIVGVTQSTGYLQRIAVDPRAQGHGVGRSLLRASLRWARRHRARSVLLNTQIDNAGAARLYESERFEPLPQRLVLLRATRT